MIGIEVRSEEGALAAIGLILDLGNGCMISLSGDDDGEDRLAGWLVRELRVYLARKVQSASPSPAVPLWLAVLRSWRLFRLLLRSALKEITYSIASDVTGQRLIR